MLICRHTIKHFCRIIFMHHRLIVFPDIDRVLSNAEQHRYIFFPDDMPLTENGILCHTRYDLRNVMAKYLSDRLRCFHPFHFFSLLIFIFFIS